MQELTTTRRWVAIILSTLGLGWGQFSLGRWRRGLAWMLLMPLLSALATVTVHAISVAIVLRIGCVVDCMRVMRRPGHLSTAGHGALLAVAALIGLFCLGIAQRTLLSQSFTITAGSAMPTLLVGDYVIADSLAARTGPPPAGTLIVYTHPCHSHLNYVGRVVGLPGQSVHVSESGFLTLDGRTTNKGVVGDWSGPVPTHGFRAQRPAPQVRHANRVGAIDFETLHYQGSTAHSPETTPVVEWPPESGYHACGHMAHSPYPFPWRVPDGHVFVLGDNRQNAADSRFWGFVPFELIEGHVEGIWFSNAGGASSRWSRSLQTVR